MDETYSFTYHRMAIGSLSECDRELIEQARTAARTAYAPYSRFGVGAAARLDDGNVLSASNQESEVLPSGMCAERILLYWVQANAGPRKIETLAITAAQGDAICTPCAACRQVIADTEKRQHHPIRILMVGTHEVIIVEQAGHLIPFRFEL